MSSITIPRWVRDLVCKLGGSDPWFIMTKSLTSSDLDLRDQNRLLIPSAYVKDYLIPMLSEAEKAAAKNGGLDVCVHARNGFLCYLKLTRWDSTGSTVINGKEYKVLLNRSFLQENDEVGLWGFRKGEEGKLCFVLGKWAW